MSAGGAFLLFMVSMPVLTLLRGSIITKMWLWHVVPVFSVAPLTVSQAISLSIVVSFMTYQDQRGKETREPAELIAVGLTFNVLVFVVAWIVHVIQVT